MTLASTLRERSPGWSAALCAMALTAVSLADEPKVVADRIFTNGAIVTMDDARPTAEALAIAAGHIVAIGSRDEVLAHRGEATEMTDLAGRTLLPGFIDAHGHVSGVATYLADVDLTPPPVGTVTNMAELQYTLRRAIAERKLTAGAWLVGRGYDDSLLAEARHPTRDDLDLVSTEHPIALIHVSGHLTACNSLALAKAGIDGSTLDPSGGIIRRRQGSREPNGVLEEKANSLVNRFFPARSIDERLGLLEEAERLYASYGVTTAQDGATGGAAMELLVAAAKQERHLIDVVSYAAWVGFDECARLLPPGAYQGGVKLGGVKLGLDGSPQGKTAYLTAPYHVPPEGRSAEYRGYPIFDDARVVELVDRFYARGVQVIAHANGDAAIDQLISAVGKAIDRHGERDHRTVVIHAQTARLDQLGRMLELGMIPSFFVAHTFFWGDWHHDSVLGAERAQGISAAGSAERIGLRFTFHNDAPVVPPNMARLIWAGVNRTTRAGRVLGENERVSVMTALRAVTRDAAWQHFDEADKGTLGVGKLADLVIVRDDPRAIDAASLLDLRIEETISRGHTAYRAAAD